MFFGEGTVLRQVDTVSSQTEKTFLFSETESLCLIDFFTVSDHRSSKNRNLHGTSAAWDSLLWRSDWMLSLLRLLAAQQVNGV